MTLVQNHLRQLNGNSKYLLLFFVAFAIQSCTIFNKPRRTPPPPPPPIEEEVDVIEDVEPEVVEVPVEIPGEPIDTVVIPDPPLIEKEQINIAVMLPFQLDKMDQTSTLPRASEYSLHVYKGIQYALQEANFTDKEVNVYVLDNFGNAETTSALLQKHPFPDVDVVVGPLWSKPLQAVAEYAKENQIPFISPLSSKATLASNNEYMISANATDQSRYSVLLDFIQSQFVNPNIALLHQPLTKEERAKDMILSLAAEKGLTVKESLSEGTEMFTVVESMLEKGRENVVITSVNDDDAGVRYFDNLMYYLNAIGTDYNVKLIATKEWNVQPSIVPAKYPNVSVFILDKYLDTTNTTKSGDFNALIQKNGGPLFEHTVQGYDIMSYLLALVDMYGADFEKYITKEEFQGLQTKFAFDRFNTGGGFAFYDNKFINVLQYRNGSWQKAN